MNARDDATGLVHIVRFDAYRHANGASQDSYGILGCPEFFRWLGQEPFFSEEMIVVRDPLPPTCLLCLVSTF